MASLICVQHAVTQSSNQINKRSTIFCRMRNILATFSHLQRWTFKEGKSKSHTREIRHNNIQPVYQQNRTLQYQLGRMRHAVASELLLRHDRNICHQTVHRCQHSSSAQEPSSPAPCLENHVHVHYLEPNAVLFINYDKTWHSFCQLWKISNDNTCRSLKLSGCDIHKNQIICTFNNYTKPSHCSLLTASIIITIS